MRPGKAVRLQCVDWMSSLQRIPRDAMDPFQLPLIVPWKRRRSRRCAYFTAAALFLCLRALQAAGQSTPLPAGFEAGSCSLPGVAADAGQTTPAAELLRAYNAQADGIHSLRGSLMVQIHNTADSGGQAKDPKPVAAMLSFRAPASVRLTGLAPFSSTQTFDLASDGRSYEMLLPDGNTMRFVAGLTDAPAGSANPPKSIQAQTIVEALRGLPAQLRGSATSTPEMSGAVKTLDVTLTTATGRELAAQLDFDLGSGTLSRMSVPDPEGGTTTRIFYKDWHRASAVGAPGKYVCFPTRIDVAQPGQSREIEFKFLSIEMNAPVLPRQFRFRAPAGAATSAGGSSGNRVTKP